MTYYKTPIYAQGNCGSYIERKEYTNKETGEIKEYAAVSVCCGRGNDKRWFMVKVFGKKAEKALQLRTGDSVTFHALYTPRTHSKDGSAVLLHDAVVTGNNDHFIKLDKRRHPEEGDTERSTAPDTNQPEEEQPQASYELPPELRTAFDCPPVFDEDGNPVGE